MAAAAQLNLSYHELVIATQTPHAAIAFMCAHNLLANAMVCQCSTAMEEKVYMWAIDESCW